MPTKYKTQTEKDKRIQKLDDEARNLWPKIEKIIDETAVFIPFGPVKGLSYSPVPCYQPDFDSPVYRQQFITAMKRRLAFIQEMNTKNNGYDALPEETMVRIQQILLELTT